MFANFDGILPAVYNTRYYIANAERETALYIRTNTPVFALPVLLFLHLIKWKDILRQDQLTLKYI